MKRNTAFPSVRFIRGFDFPVRATVTIAYPAGYEGRIPREHLNAALEAGAVEIVNAEQADRVGAPQAKEAPGVEGVAAGSAGEGPAGAGAASAQDQ